VLEGINDLGVLTRDAPATPEQHAALVRDMIGVLRQIATRARERGIKVIGATIMPDGAFGLLPSRRRARSRPRRGQRLDPRPRQFPTR
jgi:hypothetical protein